LADLKMKDIAAAGRALIGRAHNVHDNKGRNRGAL
jgi:hypothetical protein